MDNASADNTKAVVTGIPDTRLSYHRSDLRLSMRQNFERGLEKARGDIVCFLGDDDALVPSAVSAVQGWMADPEVAAVSNTRAHYGWPDFNESRRDTLLIPRGRSAYRLNSRTQLRTILDEMNYYALPCLYHGFVRRSLVERIRARDGSFFQSSQVDMYSAIALSMEDVSYVHSEQPLVVNGGSKRSNGASYQGQTEDEEKKRWLKEDDVGFLTGFDDPISVGSAVLESALRYSQLHSVPLSEIFRRDQIVAAAAKERDLRIRAGRTTDYRPMFEALDIADTPDAKVPAQQSRLSALAKSFLKMRPVDAPAYGIHDVEQAARFVDEAVRTRRTAMASDPLGQIRAAMMFRRGRESRTAEK